MDRGKMQEKDLYYTNDHEWIDFQGSVAYVGVCGFKLKGILHVEQITFSTSEGIKKQGEVIATVQYDDYQIPVHMPVDGKVISLNDAITQGSSDILLQQPENNGWIALIVPDKPYERHGLMLREQYKLYVKRRF
jgi:glycine cleavage system H protein